MKQNNNILLINKPKGITSFDVIRQLRRQMGIIKMGHAGTLDPLAAGLMIIGTNEGTKKLNEYLKLDKTYIAEILFGIQTDTGDMEGKIIQEKEVEEISKEKLEEILLEMRGKIKLQVPIYSAIKVKGKPLYKYAREGNEVEVPTKEMEIIDYKIIEVSKNEAQVKLDVSSGTYIRSLAEEIGRKLGYPATLKNLKRTRIGNFQLKDAENLS